MIEPQATDVVQFGTSRFLQAHAVLFFCQCTAPLSVTIVQSSGDASRAARLHALADPKGYPVRVRGLRDGQVIDETHQVTSVRQTLSTATDWEAVCRVAAKARFIVSNTSDKGFEPTGADLALAPSQAMSYPAKLAHILAYRYRAGHPPPILLPTELLANNGVLLKSRIMAVAEAALRLGGFSDWLDTMPAANSIVDRIVSEAIEPAGAVAEPYALWAIEEGPGIERPCDHPAITMVADLERTERLKLHILNLGHTVLAEWWQRSGAPKGATVRAAMAGDQRGALWDLWTQEVIPGFARRDMRAAAQAYAHTTLERFCNPYLDHLIGDIAQNHRHKVDRRIAAFLRWSGLDATGDAPRLSKIAAQFET